MTQDSTEPIDPLIGQTFGGKYRIIEKLGSGGMGGVYKAEQDLMNRFVAIKVLRSTFHGDEVQLRRFQQEARTLSQLSHPNAVTVFDFGIENGLPYLVMEYIEGRTLKVVIREERRLPFQRVQGILRQTCAALSEAHRLGIVHRDIKPDNIMIRPHHDGTDWIKVLDFGVAKSVVGSDPSLTQAGVLVGTPQYMSPEQCKGSELDARADIYSLGVVLYEMLSGEVPFAAPSVLELLMKVINSEPESLRKFKAMLTIPVTIDAVVLKALAKDPKDRFQNMADFYSSFEKALPGFKSPGESTGPRSHVRSLLIIIAVVIAVGGGMFVVTKKMTERRHASEMLARQKEMEAAQAAARKKAEEEAARLKADAAIKEAQAWQAEQERAKLEAERKKERELEEAKQKADLERAQMIERELALVKQRQAEMEAKVRESERLRQQQQLQRKLEDEQREIAAREAAKEAEIARKRETQRRPAPTPQQVQMRPTPVPQPPPDLQKQSGEEESGEVKKKPRRRCGPTWCD